jgi:nickel superoxide dismutase
MEEKMIVRIHKTTLMLILSVTIFSLATSIPAHAHCQIPCGIYDDYARIQSMLEDVETIQKSVRLIVALADKNDAQSKNQVVRWIMNKEKHAQNIIDTISDYFLTQRVKPNQENYAERLIKHHTVIVEAMKAKQRVDMENWVVEVQ